MNRSRRSLLRQRCALFSAPFGNQQRRLRTDPIFMCPSRPLCHSFRVPISRGRHVFLVQVLWTRRTQCIALFHRSWSSFYFPWSPCTKSSVVAFEAQCLDIVSGGYTTCCARHMPEVVVHDKNLLRKAFGNFPGRCHAFAVLVAIGSRQCVYFCFLLSGG